MGVRTLVVEDRTASPRPYSGHTKGGDRAIRVLGLAAALSCSHGLREGSIQWKTALVPGPRSWNLVKVLTGKRQGMLMFGRSQEGSDAVSQIVDVSVSDVFCVYSARERREVTSFI